VDGAPEDLHFLVQEEDSSRVAEAFPDWERRGVLLHRYRVAGGDLMAPSPVLAAGYRLEVAEGGAAAGLGLDLATWPEDARQEYELVLASPRALAVVRRGAEAVAFCYVAYETETLWDVAIDTREDHRRQGLGTACFNALHLRMSARGKRPAWGAMADNRASVEMAGKMGFELDARLWSFLPR
jgi:GNAT superfamily N-acetyltransferase